jgi:CDP-diacylglycerol--glycerol-3-phosphate 3-phosphatidyltransferase
MNIPNALTLLRIFIVPLLVAVILTNVSENWFGTPRYLVGLGLFVVAALTDLFDGMLARRWQQVSTIGKLLDPIADKLLISAALISLVEHQLAPAWAVVVIVGREFAVTGLRSIAATDGVVISASRMGKFKMVAQVVTVGLLILSISPGQTPHLSNFGRPFPAIKFWTVPELATAWSHLTGPEATSWNDWQVLLYTAGRAMLWVVVISSITSMYGYFRAFFTGVARREKSRAKTASAVTTAN